MTANIVVDAMGNPAATVTNQGTGAQAGDYVVFDPPDKVGTPVRIRVLPVLSNPPLPSDFTKWTPDKILTTVPTTFTSGTGTGLTAFITVDANGNPVATVHDAGDVAQNLWTPNLSLTPFPPTPRAGLGTG